MTQHHTPTAQRDRAPYLVGEYVQAPFRIDGVLSLIAAPVLSITPREHPTYRWTITYRSPAGNQTAHVDKRGRDDGGYVVRTVHAVPGEHTKAPAAVRAESVVHAVRALGIAGGLVRSLIADRFEAIWRWPSGNPRYSVEVDYCDDDGATFTIRAYEDAEYTEPFLETQTTCPDSAANAVAEARRQGDEAATVTCEWCHQPTDGTQVDVPSPDQTHGTLTVHETCAGQMYAAKAAQDAPEQTVVVVFDVYAPTREAAAHRISDLLRRGGACDVLKYAAIDCWWFPEAWAKPIDGNDRDAMVLGPDPSLN